jgi:hypothetical protein
MASRQASIRGLVAPAEWDEEDNLVSVVIESDDEERYHVDPKGKGEQLLDLVDWYVEVTGTVRHDDGTSTLTVQRVRELQGPGDEEEPDYEDDEGGADVDFDEDAYLGERSFYPDAEDEPGDGVRRRR